MCVYTPPHSVNVEHPFSLHLTSNPTTCSESSALSLQYVSNISNGKIKRNLSITRTCYEIRQFEGYVSYIVESCSATLVHSFSDSTKIGSSAGGISAGACTSLSPNKRAMACITMEWNLLESGGVGGGGGGGGVGGAD